MYAFFVTKILGEMKMGTIGEYYADGIEKCDCGSTDIIVIITKKMTIKRNKKLEIKEEYTNEEEETEIICKKCRKQLD